MKTEIILPKVGMAMEEGTIIRWFKKVGDSVSVSEPILEIITDKVNMEIESEVSGVLSAIVAEEGVKLPVFSVIGYIETEQAGVDVRKSECAADLKETAAERSEQKRETEDSAPKRAYEAKQNEQNKNAKLDLEGTLRATPAARSEARKRRILLHHVTGTGPNQRIQKKDVLSYEKRITKKRLSPLAKRLLQGKEISVEHVIGTGHRGKIMARDLHYELVAKSEVPVRIPLSYLEQRIAAHMSASAQTSPTFSLEMEIDMTACRSYLQRAKEDGLRHTVTDLLVAATAEALMEHPRINSTLEGDHLILHPEAHIAIAVGSEDGLRVPVIRSAQGLTIEEIAAKRSDFAQRARSGMLTLDDSTGSTFTISNLGMYGVRSFTAILNQPNAGILSTGAIKDTVVYENGGITVRPIMIATLTIDHRINDGMRGAQFLQTLKANLEGWNTP